MDSSSKHHPELLRSFSHKNAASSSSKSTLRRSHSVKNSSVPSSSTTSSSLPRSSSLRVPSSSSSKFNADAHLQSEKGSGSKARKHSSRAKEQKARFYIIRRCVAMLVCWHEHSD